LASARGAVARQRCHAPESVSWPSAGYSAAKRVLGLGVRRDRAKAPEAQNTCLYIGGFADQRQAQSLEQRLTSLDIKVKVQLLSTSEASGYWLRVAPESRRLAEDLPFENLAKEFNELKHKIMLCEGIATLE